MKFKSRKDGLFIASIFGINTFLLAIAGIGLLSNEIEIWILLCILLSVGLIFWIFFDTHYSVSTQDGLVYKSGPFKGSIALNQIKKIEKERTLWVGLKPATARKGLIIKTTPIMNFI